MSSLPSLPEEICLDILVRVPVKSTYACKCVCKTWFRIISDPDFVKLHLNRTLKTNSCSLILQNCNPNSIRSVSYDSLTSPNGFDGDVAFVESPHEGSTYTLYGSCNGLVYGWNFQLRLYFLWNPATKEYRKLPQTQDPYYLYIKFHGFGYDYKMDDYMLVNGDEIYSVKSNSWESFQSIHYKYSHVYDYSGMLFKGALHWLLSIVRTGEKSSTTMIVSIDISEKRQKELSVPRTQYYFSNMGVLEGCLCALSFSPETRETFEVWVMQDYGVPESWTILHTIMFHNVMSMRLKLVGSLRNGEILFKNGYMDNLTLYDPKYGTTRKPNIHGLKVGVTVIYFESLVSLNSITAVGSKKKRKISRNLKKGKPKKLKTEEAERIVGVLEAIRWDEEPVTRECTSLGG